MLHGVVGNFLDSLTEREFDAPLLAILAARGCTDIHFIHGAFEFGKDVIAKRRDPVTGDLYQLSIQSKAGDLRQPEWRAVRPQLEECEYNTRAHPSFDETLPRVAVLVTTGRLKGAASTDAQEYRERCAARNLADFEVWDRETLLEWFSEDPSVGLAGESLEPGLLATMTAIQSGSVTEPTLERYSRGWLETGRSLSRASLEASIVCQALRSSRRLDLASLFSLHLLRAAVASLPAAGIEPEIASSAIRLFRGYAVELLDSAEPLLADPKELAYPLTTFGGAATYPVACCRLLEIFALLALASDDEETSIRAKTAVYQLALEHPGAARPPSDAFAASIAAPVIVLASDDPSVAVTYLRAVASWLLDRHDPEADALGLASLDESEDVVIGRLLGGRLTTTSLKRRTSSYVATMLLDLIVLVDASELYEAVRDNIAALRMVPMVTIGDESVAGWRRGGRDVWPHPRVEYPPWAGKQPNHANRQAPGTTLEAVILASVCRSRHYPSAMRDVLRERIAGR